MSYAEVGRKITEDLQKLDKIANWLESYRLGLLYPDRFVSLVSDLLECEEKDEARTNTAG